MLVSRPTSRSRAHRGRFLMVVPVLGLLAGSATATLETATAEAAPAAPATCSVQLEAPPTIAIDRPHQEIAVGFADTCGVAASAAFDVYGPRGLDATFAFDGTYTETWAVDDDQTLGTFESRSAGAYDASGRDLAVAPSSIRIKRSSRASISSRRSGSTVTLDVRATSYSPRTNTFTPWDASSATVQYATSDGWATLAPVELKDGQARVTTTSTAKRTYRVVLGATATRWGVASGPTTR